MKTIPVEREFTGLRFTCINKDRRDRIFLLPPSSFRPAFALCAAAALSCRPLLAQTPPATGSLSAPHLQTAPALPADSAPADLASDTRLDRAYSVHEVGIPLGELLHSVSSADVPLFADRNCNTLKLHLRLVKRPLRQLMNALAQLVPGTWYKSPDGKGYILRMTPSAVRRRQRWWELFLQERQGAQASLAAAALQTMRARPELQGEVHAGDGNHEGLRQLLLSGPTFFNGLPPALQEKLAGALNDTLLYQGGGVMASGGTDIDEGAVLVPFADLPTGAQKMFTAGAQAPLDNAWVRFENTGLALSARVVNSSGSLPGSGFDMSVPAMRDAPAILLNQEPLRERVQKMGRDAPAAWKELAAYQQGRVWPNSLPPGKSLTYNMPGWEHVGVWEGLAQAGNMEFVADYHSLAKQGTPPLPTSLKRPLPAELNAHALALDQSWKQTREGVYLMRNNRWYRDDLLEAPAPVLRRWMEQYARAWAKEDWKRLPLLPDEAKTTRIRRLMDWKAEVVTTLTPWQIFSGLRYAAPPYGKEQEYASDNPYVRVGMPFFNPVDALLTQYHTVHFYAGLSDAQRADLIAGRLDAAALTAEQVQQALYLQPRLAIYLSRAQRPIRLGLRAQSLGAETHADMRLAITAPASEPPNPPGSVPSSGEQ